MSCGAANRGALAAAVLLPPEGEGYVVPEPWRSRGLSFGTQELVGVVSRAAARVAKHHPGAVLGVADLSAETGGALPGHRSHQSGRDVDLIYYAVDEQGEPMEPDEHMPYYTRARTAYYAQAPVWSRSIERRYFDVARNWALVKALLDDEYAQVDRIFVSARVERWLISHAIDIGEDEALVMRARLVLHSPRHAKSHNDHMHVRVACSETDRNLGRCRENAPRRRRGKYRARIRCPRVLPIQG